MKNIFDQSVSPSDFRQMLKYFFFLNYEIGDELYLKSSSLGTKYNDDKSNFDFNLRYQVNGYNYTPKFMARIKLDNMIGSSIEGVPFYKHKLIQEAKSFDEHKKLLESFSPIHYSPSCYVLGVTPIANIINGADKIYPFYMYNGIEKFREVTQEFQKITFDDLFELYNSGFNSRFQENHYYKSVDFSENAPFTFNFPKREEFKIVDLSKFNEVSYQLKNMFTQPLKKDI